MTIQKLISFIEDQLSQNRFTHIGPDQYISGNKIFTFECLIEKGYSVIVLKASDLLQIRRLT